MIIENEFRKEEIVMPKWLRSAVVIALAALMLLGLILPAFAAEETEQPFISIHTVEDLQKLHEDPSGNYILEEKRPSVCN